MTFQRKKNAHLWRHLGTTFVRLKISGNSNCQECQAHAGEENVEWKGTAKPRQDRPKKPGLE